MNRIEQLLKSKKSNVLAVYFTAGFPVVDSTLELIEHLDRSEVDILEIGLPFSDPLADGPVIQSSSQQAIRNGMSISYLMSQLSGLRAITAKPVVLMGYLNPIMQYGEQQFVRACLERGIDGLIIPDMPLGYLRKNWQADGATNDLLHIRLIAPCSSDERIRELDSCSQGFNYVVSSNSTTGTTDPLDKNMDYLEHVSSLNLRNPLLVGFGIHDAQSFHGACSHAAGAIVGSAFIRHLETQGVSGASVSRFVSSIRGASIKIPA